MSGCHHHHHHCATCADEAVPMTVERVDLERGLALCHGEHGERHTVEIALVDSVMTGDRVLVHAGVALAAVTA